MSLSRRVELLFDPKEYSDLEEVARSRGESVGALIRHAVKTYYIQPDLKEKQEAARLIIRQEVDFGSWEDVKVVIGKSINKRLETS